MTTKTAPSIPCPPGWRLNVRRAPGGGLVCRVQAAPVDLVAVNAVAYPARAGAPWVNVCPTAYERPWCEASAALGAIWSALCAGSDWRELWIGAPGRPFEVIGK
jgi:hypothetical protein